MTGLALQRVELLRPLPRWRIAAAVLIVAVALASAVALHGHQVRQPVTPCIGTVPCTQLQRPGWVDPAALVICLLGIGAAAALLTTRHRDS
jgi:hypothetical protein